MATRFVVVPQWQGSGSTRAMRLIDGAEMIRGDLPASASTAVEVPLGAGESLGSGVARFSSIAAVRDRTARVLTELAPGDTAITIGGDCGVELAAVEHAAATARADGERLALVWFDAHPDLNLPDPSAPGAFCGMVLRAILGDGADGLCAPPDRRVPANAVVLAGTRIIEEAEAAYLAEHALPVLPTVELSGAHRLADAVAATGATRVYLHIDLDVLDPGILGGIGDPQPFGVTLPTLVANLRELTSRCELAGAGITMFSPPSPSAAAEDLPVILRILSALTAPRERDALPVDVRRPR